MIIPRLSEGAIHEHAAAESFRRGEDYYQGGAVLSLVRRGDVLQAEVEGSQYEPYRVRVTFDRGGITGVTCSCPYDWGGWCKHVVAVLLACLRNPEEIEERPVLDEVIAELDRGQLAELVLGLAARAQAARIVEAGQAQYYHHAVGWLERERAGYRAAGREGEWQAYLREIREGHGRKHKLMGMIKGM